MSTSVLSNVIVVIEKSRKSIRIYPDGNINVSLFLSLCFSLMCEFSRNAILKTKINDVLIY